MQTAETVVDEETGEVIERAPLAVVPAIAPLAPVQSRAVMMRAFIEAESEVRALVRDFVKLHMREGDDFGVIPGTPKPTLLKPGAEKLVDLFNVEPEVEISSRVEDWDKPLFHYEIKVTLRERTSRIVRAIGIGSANSREGRYRWRNGERLCPECGKPTIIKGKAEYGGGFICFAKKGGCGAKFKDDDAGIVDQVVGKVENDDVYALVNTILKMAKKRALVDGAIALARCSDIFTQDVEDLPQMDEPRRPEPRAQQQAEAPKQERKPVAPDVPRFSTQGKWVHAKEWNGKRLADAPLDVLEVYREVVLSAAATPARDKVVARVELAIEQARAEAALAGAPQGNGWVDGDRITDKSPEA